MEKNSLCNSFDLWRVLNIRIISERVMQTKVAYTTTEAMLNRLPKLRRVTVWAHTLEADRLHRPTHAT